MQVFPFFTAADRETTAQLSAVGPTGPGSISGVHRSDTWQLRCGLGRDLQIPQARRRKRGQNPGSSPWLYCLYGHACAVEVTGLLRDGRSPLKAAGGTHALHVLVFKPQCKLGANLAVSPRMHTCTLSHVHAPKKPKSEHDQYCFNGASMAWPKCNAAGST